ncbi:16664_t:CDS:1, partial [Funneliformis geosporum]
DKTEYVHSLSKGYRKLVNYIHDHSNSNKLNQLMIKLDKVTSQLEQLHDDFRFTNERVTTMKILLNVYFTSPKQATTIKASLTGKKMKDDYIMKADIDTSESI